MGFQSSVLEAKKRDEINEEINPHSSAKNHHYDKIWEKLKKKLNSN